MKKTNLKVVAEDGVEVCDTSDQIIPLKLYPELDELKKKLYDTLQTKKETFPLNMFFLTNKEGVIEGKFGLGLEIARWQIRDVVVDIKHLHEIYDTMSTYKTYEMLDLGLLVDFGEDWEELENPMVTARYMVLGANHTLAITHANGAEEHTFQVLDFYKDLDGDYNKVRNIGIWSNNKEKKITLDNHETIWEDTLLGYWAKDNQIWAKGGQFYPRSKTELAFKKWFVATNAEHFVGQSEKGAVATVNLLLQYAAPDGARNNTNVLQKYKGEKKLQERQISKIMQLEEFSGYKCLGTRGIGSLHHTGLAEILKGISEGNPEVVVPLYLDTNAHIEHLERQGNITKTTCEDIEEGLNSLIMNIAYHCWNEGKKGNPFTLDKVSMVSIKPQFFPYTYSDNIKETKRLDKVNKMMRK